MEYFINKLGPAILVIVVMGALVDIFQFLWIVKRMVRRAHKKYYQRVRRQVLKELNEPDDEPIL